MRVLVAYNNFRSGCRAMALLKRLAGRSGESVMWPHVMIRFDLLEEASVFELAVSQALTVDMVVIAAAEGQALPQKVRDWLIEWLMRKEDAPQAMVATLEDHPATGRGQIRVAAELEKLAGYGNVSFFSNEGESAAKVSSYLSKPDGWALDSALVRPQVAGRN